MTLLRATPLRDRTVPNTVNLDNPLVQCTNSQTAHVRAIQQTGCPMFHYGFLGHFDPPMIEYGDTRSNRSMGHGVGHNVDSQWVGHFHGELLEELVVFAFSFPPIADVVVVAE